MSIILGNGSASTETKVDSVSRALRVNLAPRGHGYRIGEQSGTIAAALGANSAVYAQRIDPGAAVNAWIDRVRVAYTTVVAFTTPITAGRRLALFRGSGAAASGGTAIATAVKMDTGIAPASECDAAQGGDMRIATTGALTVTGITWESQPFGVLTLVHVGAAGAFVERVFEFHATEAHDAVLQPGQLLGLRNPAAMDAAGTWQFSVEVAWREAAAFAS